MDTNNGQSMITEGWLITEACTVKEPSAKDGKSQLMFTTLISHSLTIYMLKIQDLLRRGLVLKSTVDHIKPMMGVCGRGLDGTGNRNQSPIRLQTFKAGSHRNLTKCSGSVCRPPVPYENTSASYGWTKQWVLQHINITEELKWPRHDEDGSNRNTICIHKWMSRFCKWWK